jgi:hypothetical protein
VGFVNIGTPIGAGESFGSKSCVVTLSSDAPRTNSSVTRGLLVVSVTRDNAADLGPPTYGGSNIVWTPVITDNSSPSAPYTGMSNYQLAGDYCWNTAGGPVAARNNPTPTFYVLQRGAIPYVVVTDLNAGAQVTVDFATMDHTPQWLGVQIHPVDEIPTGFVSAVRSTTGHPWFSNTVHTPPAGWRQTLMSFTVAVDETTNLHWSLFNDAFGEDGEDVLAPGAEHPLTHHAFYKIAPGDSSDGALEYGTADLYAEYGNIDVIGSTQAFPDDFITAEFCVSEIRGGTGGIPYPPGLVMLQQIYRRTTG